MIKQQCVWCCTESTKHAESKLIPIPMITHGQLSKESPWPVRSEHADKINCLMDSVADQPYALEIRYHLKCWLKYVRSYQKMSEDDKLPSMHNVTLHEAHAIFFDHIKTVIFEEHELRAPQSLLRDHSCILSRYGFPISRVTSSYVKDFLTWEFQGKPGFRSHPWKNQNDSVYDTYYVEAGLSCIGVSSEQLVPMWPGPPRFEKIQEEEELSPLVMQLLSSLRGRRR